MKSATQPKPAATSPQTQMLLIDSFDEFVNYKGNTKLNFILKIEVNYITDFTKQKNIITSKVSKENPPLYRLVRNTAASPVTFPN